MLYCYDLAFSSKDVSLLLVIPYSCIILLMPWCLRYMLSHVDILWHSFRLQQGILAACTKYNTRNSCPRCAVTAQPRLSLALHTIGWSIPLVVRHAYEGEREEEHPLIPPVYVTRYIHLYNHAAFFSVAPFLLYAKGLDLDVWSSTAISFAVSKYTLTLISYPPRMEKRQLNISHDQLDAI